MSRTVPRLQAPGTEVSRAAEVALLSPADQRDQIKGAGALEVEMDLALLTDGDHTPWMGVVHGERVSQPPSALP